MENVSEGTRTGCELKKDGWLFDAAGLSAAPCAKCAGTGWAHTEQHPVATGMDHGPTPCASCAGTGWDLDPLVRTCQEEEPSSLPDELRGDIECRDPVRNIGFATGRADLEPELPVATPGREALFQDEPPCGERKQVEWATFAHPGVFAEKLVEGMMNDSIPKVFNNLYTKVKHTASQDAQAPKKSGLFPLPVNLARAAAKSASGSFSDAAVAAWLPLVCASLNQLAGWKKEVPTEHRCSE